VLYYQRTDAETTLDYNSLPQQPDYSILSVDHSIAKNRDPKRIQHSILQPEELPTAGTLISIDAEFVSLQQVRSDDTTSIFMLMCNSKLTGGGRSTFGRYSKDHSTFPHGSCSRLSSAWSRRTDWCTVRGRPHTYP